MTNNSKAGTPLILISFGLLGWNVTVANELAPTGYVMNFYLDSAQGAAVEDGAYERAIKTLTKKDTQGARRIADQVNLCVAYTKTRQLDEATEACDLALAMAGKRFIRPNLTGFDRAEKYRANEEKAIALVNRGVLYAIAGNSNLAKEMFETAEEIGTNSDTAATNLLVLQRDIAERDS